jgi:hypothetical protein
VPFQGLIMVVLYLYEKKNGPYVLKKTLLMREVPPDDEPNERSPLLAKENYQEQL